MERRPLCRMASLDRGATHAAWLPPAPPVRAAAYPVNVPTSHRPQVRTFKRWKDFVAEFLTYIRKVRLAVLARLRAAAAAAAAPAEVHATRCAAMRD